MKKIKYITIKNLIYIALIMGLFILGYKYALGFILGCIAYFLNFKLLEYKYNHMLSDSKLQMFMWTVLCISILAFSLLFAFILPNVFSYWFVFIGILICKYSMVFKELKGAK